MVDRTRGPAVHLAPLRVVRRHDWAQAAADPRRHRGRRGLLLGQTPAPAPAAGAGAAGIDPRAVDSAVTAAMRERRVPGASIALARGGRGPVGEADGRAPLNPLPPPH